MKRNLVEVPSMLTGPPQYQGEPRSGFHKGYGTTPWFRTILIKPSY